jgi:Fe-coproporphyrin III synthase
MASISKKIITVGIGKIKNKLVTKISKITGKNFTVPVQIYWNISNKCNFRCKMCTQWDRGNNENPDNYLNFQDMQRVIDEMNELHIRNFGVTGGEPLLQKRRLFEVLEYANNKGIYTHFGSNGWLIDENVIREYDKIGGGHISLSIDAVGDLHDEIRGVKGAYQHAVSVLEQYKKIKPKSVSIKINTVMSSKNLDHILPLVKLAEKYKASIFIQPFEDFEHDTLYKDSVKIDSTFAVKEKNLESVKKVIKKLIAIKKARPGLILNSYAHLEKMTDYFKNRKNAPGLCEVGYKKFTIHPFGDVIFCGYLGFIGNVKKDGLMDIWNSSKAETARKKMTRCNLNCMQGCFFEPGFFELIRDGFFYLAKAIKK